VLIFATSRVVNEKTFFTAIILFCECCAIFNSEPDEAGLGRSPLAYQVILILTEEAIQIVENLPRWSSGDLAF
jgi:hypothetical protein